MREITSSEKKFISTLLKHSSKNFEVPKLVRELDDGGMGSFSFDLNETKKREKSLVEGNFEDKDGCIVDFELTLDSQGDLFELDFFKVDFSPLINLPSEDQIKITTSNIT